MAKPGYIVGIGASAGGLSALELFFSNMPEDTGMAFIVVQHLSPDFKSLMDNLLARHTHMPIHRVEDGMEVAANSVYLIPPKKLMTLSGGKLFLQEREPVSQHLEMPIDVFLHSLAEDAGNRSIAVILSGTGSDGSHGIVDIHDMDGLVIVQSVETAQFDGMPRNAIATGICDYILSPEEMPQLLADYVSDPHSIRHRSGLPQDLALSQGDYGVIFALLRRNYGIDFSKYKSTTVGRRIFRRMELRGLTELSEYTQLLSSDAFELDTLYQDLLIGVTEFFRDPKAFAFIQTNVLPTLLQRAGDEGIRIWIAGCATGEEAYSLAILIHEEAQRQNYMGKISIFATDAHRISLEKASAGVYESGRLVNVSPERLANYFQVEGPGRYRVNNDLRKLVVFANQNLIQDPPFTRMDLVSCRNVMIYLQPETQEKVLALFNFSLKMEGVLFIGSSEGLGRYSDHFDPLNSMHRIYRKIRDSKILFDFNAPPQDATRVQASNLWRPISRTTISLDRQIMQDYDALLRKHLPPGVLVDENGRVLHYFPGANNFLKPLEGRAETDILRMVEGDLQLAISVAMRRASHSGQTVTIPNVRTHENEMLIDLMVERFNDTGHYHITFQPHPQTRPALAAPNQPFEGSQPLDFDTENALRGQITDLEIELQSTKENLQATVEELQTSNEELQATNEELLAANEELQSTNEELHSVNEELYTVNAEFDKKNRELLQLNQDHENLLASIDAGTVFLDENLCIRKFNPASADSFKLLPQDIGRPISHIAYHLTDQAELEADVKKALLEAKTISREVRTQDGRWLLKKVLPFRTEQGEIKGVVLTFTDITYQKQVEESIYTLNQRLESKVHERTLELGMANQQLQELVDRHEVTLEELSQSELLHRTLFETMAQGVIYHDADGKIVSANPAAASILGLTVEEILNRSAQDAEWKTVHEDGSECPPEELPSFKALQSGQPMRGAVLGVFNPRVQQYRWIQIHARPLFRAGESKPYRVFTTFEDITARKQAEERLRLSLEEKETLLREVHHRVKNNLQIISSLLGLQTNYVHNPDTLSLFEDSRERVHSMALVHEKLYRSADLARIDYQEYLIDLCGYLLQMTAHGRRVSLEIHAEGIYLGVDVAVPVSLLINELLTNAIKYAFPTDGAGKIEVHFTREDGRYHLVVQDDGVGLPKGYDWQKSETFGLRLVGMLVRQLEGTVAVVNRAERPEGPGGLRFDIYFDHGEPPK